jgi:polyferredoxin
MKKRQKLRMGIILFSFFLFPATFYYLSPVLIVQAASQGIMNGSFIIFALQFMSALLLGRAFCGWACPAAGCVLKRGGYEKVDFLYETTYGISVSGLSSLIAYFVVLFLLIVLPAYTVGRRSFCHHLCWMAPFMILGRKVRNAGGWPSLRLAVESEKCTHCHTCTQNCPMSLPVEGMVEKGRMENAECILCGSCVDGCKYDVLRYSFRSSVE